MKILGKEEVVQDLDDNLYADNFDKNNINVTGKQIFVREKVFHFRVAKQIY